MNTFSSMNGKQLLAEYNKRAAAAGKPQLASVKLSKSQLIARIEALPSAEANDVSTIAGFMREHGINPKVGRAALRRAGFSAPYDMSNADIMAVVNKMIGA